MCSFYNILYFISKNQVLCAVGGAADEKVTVPCQDQVDQVLCLFLPGSMVAEFEDAVKAQEEYQVSDPVESNYGYHVIVTLPLDPDAIVDYSSNGTALTARSTAANAIYAKALDDFTLEQAVVPTEGFEAPNLTDYLK